MNLNDYTVPLTLSCQTSATVLGLREFDARGFFDGDIGDLDFRVPVVGLCRLADTLEDHIESGVEDDPMEESWMHDDAKILRALADAFAGLLPPGVAPVEPPPVPNLYRRNSRKGHNWYLSEGDINPLITRRMDAGRPYYRVFPPERRRSEQVPSTVFADFESACAYAGITNPVVKIL